MIYRFSQADVDPCTFLYLYRDDIDQLLFCYLFQALKQSDVTEVYQQMKDNQSLYTPTPPRSLSSGSSLTSLSLDISPSSSNFFEVLYIGKIKVWNRKVPDSFIDDALQKFEAHDLEKKANVRAPIERLQSEQDLYRRLANGPRAERQSSPESPPVPSLTRSLSVASSLIPKQIENQYRKEILSTNESDISDNFSKISIPEDGSEDTKSSKSELSETSSFTESSKAGGDTTSTSDYKEGSDSSSVTSRDEKKEMTRTVVDMDDHNRTMVLQVGRIDLRLISPDRKLILLHKQTRDIATCVQGRENSSHFGFISRETPTSNIFIGYVFKCESASIASEAVGAITQAFTNAESKFARPIITSCEQCPMVWFHKLCVEVENLSDRKTQAAILRRIDQLDEEEQSMILAKFRGAETDSVREQNEFLMMLLRAHCEMKQGRHVHDTAENRSEFLNQYLGGSTIFMKAKRSLTNSFDNLLKRRSSRDDVGATFNRDMTLPIHSSLKEGMSPASANFQETSDRESEGSHSPSTLGSQSDLRDPKNGNPEPQTQSNVSPERTGTATDKGLKSPMMDIFMKVGSSPKSVPYDEGSPKYDAGSWRQAIFKRVITPNKQQARDSGQKRSNEELRMLWKKGIQQAILLVRMEKENARIKAQQEENAVKRIKLEYDDMKLNQREVMEVWDQMIDKDIRVTRDNNLLLHAVRQGIPRAKRGEVWQFLAEESCKRTAPVDTSKFPNYNVPYETLLKQLTSHQHAILIDLGRTFPNHSYYSSPLGQGQLALFNLLKAYSLLDPEVGYCQGLSFVGGVLLLHMEEAQAFSLLRHLMFRRNLRKQYLPDMVALQIKLYQISRLLHDQIPELYDHFDLHEVAPTLYAAPWLLTIFASQFPLGFVTRVFDILFLENTDIIFKVAIALLSLHKDNLLKCDSFEEIMDYLKNKVTNMDKFMLDKVIKKVATLDIKKQLNEYKVEYHVLQEEMAAVQPQLEALHKLQKENKILTDLNKSLTSQVDLHMSNVHRLEKSRTILQSNCNKLEMTNRGLEVTVVTLVSFVNSLIENKVDVEIPDDVRRILTQVSFNEKNKKDQAHRSNVMRMFGKDNHPNAQMIKSLSTGKMNLSELTPFLPANADSMSRSNSLNTQSAVPLKVLAKSVGNSDPSIDKPAPFRSTISNPNMANKMSNFFSSSHAQILQQKLHSPKGSNPKIDIRIEDCVDYNSSTSKTTSDCTEMARNVKNLGEKSVSLPLQEKILGKDNKTSPTYSEDSGIGTPSSPKDTEIHPLSNCDVPFTYSGTRTLKKV
ncbi:TBC1 domain family member 1 isoform X3 [Agrilus planipennis]|nr:TBC1 domain family member 1 isoform X3 [Agrilus planipennis]